MDKIVVSTRCLNGKQYIERFLKGYGFADKIVVSDGGSRDGSIELFKENPKVEVAPFSQKVVIDEYEWNPDNPHIQHAIDEGMKHDPTWLILDDLDDVPNFHLRKDARALLEQCSQPQVNAFRLYLWGETQYFPYMNRYFDKDYVSLWGWKPSEIDIHADPGVRHGTIVGTTENHQILDVPYCLLHKSWSPETIEDKIARYNALGLPMNHPFEFAGPPTALPGWAME